MKINEGLGLCTIKAEEIDQHAVDGTFGREFACRLPIEHCKPRFLETKACEFLRQHRQEPFILYVNFLEPHSPFFGPLDREHGLDEVYLPANFSDPLEENEPLRYRLMREDFEQVYGRDEAAFKELTRKYWGLVTQVDRSVGAILKTLEQLGLADNTIVAARPPFHPAFSRNAVDSQSS